MYTVSVNMEHEQGVVCAVSNGNIATTASDNNHPKSSTFVNFGLSFHLWNGTSNLRYICAATDKVFSWQSVARSLCGSRRSVQRRTSDIFRLYDRTMSPALLKTRSVDIGRRHTDRLERWLKQGNRGQQTSPPRAQFSSATRRVTANN